jgi:hypothetical protein
MIPSRCPLIAVLVLALAGASMPAAAGVATPHLLSLQGEALDSSDEPVLTGDVGIRIYTAATGGDLVYDSGTDFDGAIVDGVFNILLGSVTPLELDNTLLYYLEMDINAEEVVGDATSGRQAFYPGGGSHDRQDLEDRLEAVEDLVFLECDPGYYDLNGNPSDGCEFYLDPQGIYVAPPSAGGEDLSGCGGAPWDPCATIDFGLDEALASGATTVYVADGLYDEVVDIKEGISLRGGYRDDTWERHLASTNTIISGGTISGHSKTVVANGITETTDLEGFVVDAQDNSSAMGNSYALWIADSPGLRVLENRIQAGDGGNGYAGSDGGSGSDGPDGAAGLDAYETTHDCYAECDGTGSENAGGAGGSRSCGGVDISGGDGGTAWCPDWNETEDLCVAAATGESQTPTSGESGPNGGGAGGASGLDGIQDWYTFGDCYCHLPSASMLGADGSDGSSGYDGSAGMGASNSMGIVTGQEWSGTTGGLAADGQHGRGGGGGGAGGGVEAYYYASCTYGRSDIGASGGGGGAGGCAGLGGTGGTAGGGSFAIFVVFSTPPGTIPEISGNTLYQASGGSGGRGGHGGAGGDGGDGAAGGIGGSGALTFCAGAAGKGGDGGDGGHGGGGGGGAGGVSYGIFAYGQGGADLSAWASGNFFGGGGSGGTGGAGGASMGNSGGHGTSGATGYTNF